MSKLATYFKESVSVLKKGFAYARGVPVLLLALFKRLTGDSFYEVSFTKIGRKWYCNVPGFPKELLEHTLMVGGASKFQEYYSRGENEIKAIIKIAAIPSASSSTKSTKTTCTATNSSSDINGTTMKDKFLHLTYIQC